MNYYVQYCNFFSFKTILLLNNAESIFLFDLLMGLAFADEMRHVKFVDN